MPFTKFSNLDFDQIKTSIKDYLRANSNFTDFDFEGSNFSLLIDTLAYNTYINAFNANMIVNESFLDSAIIRENVVSLARTIGYVPRSRTASQSKISFQVVLTDDTPTVTLKSGLVCVSFVENSRYLFSIPSDIIVPVIDGVATFDNITIYQGNFLTETFVVDGSIDQRFILNNEGVDTSTLNVYVKGVGINGLGEKYSLVENIINVNKDSKIFLLQEVLDERYEILFGDGIFGKKLENQSVITASYIQTDGKLGNDTRNFVYQGTLENTLGNIIFPKNRVEVTTNVPSRNGDDIEGIESIKYYAPRLYSSQYRAVTSSDYEAIISSQIYPNTESISVIGGEELDPPKFGTVLVSIKPKNGVVVPEFEKENIINKLKQYSIAGINVEIVDLKILYVELDSSVYYNSNQISSIEGLKSNVISTITSYSKSLDLNNFGGRLKYSKLLSIIDNSDRAITSNITKIIIRRDISAVLDQFSQYELCYGNRFNVVKGRYNIKSTGFTIRIEQSPGNIVESQLSYFVDTPNDDMRTGVISIITPNSVTNSGDVVLVKNAGTVDYIKGEIIINTVFFASTERDNNIIEIQAYPESNDVIALKDLFMVLDVSKSKINMVKDLIASGDDNSGVLFANSSFRSSYSNGTLERS
jgi:hypothetical protein